jgi:cytochrome c oxidase subunit 3
MSNATATAHEEHAHGVVLAAPGPGFLPHTVAHHFDTSEQEYQACKLGFWLFLATEILLFGGLFAAYFYFHHVYEETFRECGQQLDWKLGALNTTILLVSSWTMAMAVRSAATSRKGPMMRYLTLTVLGAFGFLCVKYVEYSSKWEHGFMPGRFFEDKHDVLANVEHPNLFFSLYFTMTGLHGVHVAVGAGLILWIMKGGAKGRFHANYYLPVDLVGLYWHLVDLIWIFLFPLLYLVP